MKTQEQIGELVKEAFSGESGGFRPCAFFDDRLDCIRVIARDCSVLEVRVNETLTVLVDNYPETGQNRYVGFTVKGARHFCQQHGFDLATPIKVSELLDAVLATFPELVVQLFVDLVARPLIRDEKIDRVDIFGLIQHPT